jgi:Zn-dependent metalloprotease
LDGTVYRAAPGIEHIPDVTYHNVSLQYLKNIVNYPDDEAFASLNSEAIAIVYSYSDILAVMAKQSRLKQSDPESANWLIWEGYPALMIDEDPIRDPRPVGSFKAPTAAFDWYSQVAHMRDFKRAGSDAIPQINCGIFNKAFYETAQKLGNTEHAGRIWIDALRNTAHAKDLTATKFAALLEDAAPEPDKSKIREALELVGIKSSPTSPKQDPALTAPSPS